MINVGALANNALGADHRSLTNLSLVPNPGAGSDLGVGGHIRGRMNMRLGTCASHARQLTETTPRRRYTAIRHLSGDTLCTHSCRGPSDTHFRPTPGVSLTWLRASANGR